MRMSYSVFPACLVASLGVFYGCHGACTYAELDFDLYDCFDSRSVTAEYAFPVMGSQSDAVSFCSTHLSAINSCVEAAIQTCSSNNDVTKFFGTGSGLSDAYTYLCNQFTANSNVEPFTCAVNASAGNIKGYLGDFDTSVDALSSPSLTEICAYADVMIAGFTSEITSACSGSSTSQTIWNTYMSMLKSACSDGVETTSSSVTFLFSVILATFFNFYNV